MVSFAALSVVSLVTLAPHSGAAQREDTLARVRELRLGGALAEARALAERRLAAGGLDPHIEIDFRLELARMHDRVGFHENVRPVLASLLEIRAEALTTDAALLARAKVELAKADYHYQAEIRQREFLVATIHAGRAIELFREAGDRHGEADAVHTRGLIHL